MIRFLTKTQVVAEQLNQLTTYGGGEPGIVKPGTLDSAVEQPKQTFGGEFLHSDVHEMASAYLVSLVMGHAFANGNKRIGLASALIFLFANGTIIEATTDEVVALVLEVISGARSREDAAEFFRSHVAVFASSTHALRIEGVDDATLVADGSAYVNNTFAEAFAILAQ
jgi:death-on-curing protein